MSTTPTMDLPQTEQEQETNLQTQLTRMRRQLEAVYGPERIWSWLNESQPLPAAHVVSAASVSFDAIVESGGFKRGKDGAKVRINLVANRKGLPLDDLGELSDENAVMQVTISPRVVQQSFLTAVDPFGPELDYDPDAPLEEPAAPLPGAETADALSDSVLAYRLQVLGKEQLPEGWKDWPQDKKELVCKWAELVVLKASDNESVAIPEPPPDVAAWYLSGPTPKETSANGWTDAPPPHLSDAQAEQIATGVEQASAAAKPTKAKKGKPVDESAG